MKVFSEVRMDTATGSQLRNQEDLLGGSWYVLTNNNCTYNHIRALKGAYKWVKSASSNWLRSIMNLQVGLKVSFRLLKPCSRAKVGPYSRCSGLGSLVLPFKPKKGARFIPPLLLGLDYSIFTWNINPWKY